MRWFPADSLAWKTLLFAAGFEFGLGAIAWGIGRMAGIDVTESVRFTFHGLAWGIVATIPMLVGLLLLLRWPVGPFAELSAKTRHFSQTFLAPCGIFGLAVISLGAGVGEELLTRGLIHTLALRYLIPVIALVVTGILFGLMHPISLSYVVIAGFIGVYIGVVWHLSGMNLIAPIVAHACYDFVALLVLCRIKNTV